MTRVSMPETPQEAGRRFEAEWTALIGGDLVPGSGNQWFAKLDVEGGSIVYSLKATVDDTYDERELAIALAEAEAYITSPGGPGGVCVAALAYRCRSMSTNPVDRVLMSGAAHVQAMSDEVRPIGSHAKRSDQIAATAMTSELDRQ
jgi:hypothetical protein